MTACPLSVVCSALQKGGILVLAVLALTVAAGPEADATPGSASRADSLLNQLTQEDEPEGPLPPSPQTDPTPSEETPVPDSEADAPLPMRRPLEAPSDADADPSPVDPLADFAVDQPEPRQFKTPAQGTQNETASTESPAPTSSPSGDEFDVILNRGTLRVGTILFAPYAMRDAAGTLIGHEIDIALTLGADLGVEVDVVPLAEGELIGALARNAIDVIIAAYAVTPSRALSVTFTRPYARRAVHVVAARRGIPRVQSLDDLNRSTVQIGVPRGTLEERVATERLAAAQLVPFPDSQAAKKALLENQVGILIAASPFPEVLVAQSPDQFVMPLDEPLGETALAFGIRRGNPDLLAYLDAWILARSLDQFLTKTRDYWFNTTDWLPRLTEAPRIDRIESGVR